MNLTVNVHAASTRSPSLAGGFTLLEVITAVAVLAILMGLAVPSYSSFTARQRIRTASFDLTTDLVLARSEALKRNRAITVTPREASWTNGWIIAVTDTAEEVRSRNTLGRGLTVSTAPASITFNGAGRVVIDSGVEKIGLAVAAGSQSLHRCITLDPAGRPRILTEACS